MFTEQYDCPLLAHNTFGVEAKAYCLLTYASEDELKAALAHVGQQHTGRPLLHIGGGSNLLFLSDYEGVLLHSAIHTVEVTGQTEEHVFLRVGAGVVWDDFVEYCVENHYYGVENLSLIPGEVGAAAVQNIGAYGAEIKDIISGVVCYDLKERRKCRFKMSECGYGYRSSMFKEEGSKGRYVVTSVLFRLTRKASPRLEYKGLKEALNDMDGLTPQKVREAVIGIRRSKLPDPEELGSAGSFFKNPVVSAEEFARISPDGGAPHYLLPDGSVKLPAAWLIDSCGLKGAVHGGAAVYERQPLVIVNASGGATPEDVLALERRIVDEVKSRYGVELHPEVEHI